MELRITKDEYRADPRRFYDAVLSDPELRVVVVSDGAETMAFESCPPDAPPSAPRGVWFGSFRRETEGYRDAVG